MTLMGVAAAALASVVAHSNAAIVVNETFSYADGNLVGNDPAIGAAWAAHSGAGSTAVQVTSGAAVLAQGGGSREDVNIGFEGGIAAGPGTVLTATFDLTIPAITGNITSVYFAHFLEGTSNFPARLWLTAPTSTGFRLALSNDSSITDGDGEVFTGDLAFGTVYGISLTYDYTGMSSSLSINGGPSLTAVGDTTVSDEVTAFGLRQGSGNSTQIIDNLVIDAVVPEPTSLAAIAGLAVFANRRRSR